MEAGKVRPTLAEWEALPNTVRQAVPLLRLWRTEIENEEAERRAKR